jgi:hypothetical protein
MKMTTTTTMKMMTMATTTIAANRFDQTPSLRFD